VEEEEAVERASAGNSGANSAAEEMMAKKAEEEMNATILALGETAAAAEAAAQGEGDLFGLAVMKDLEVGRAAMRASLQLQYESAGHLTGIIHKCGLRLGVAAIERVKKYMENQLESEGGKAAIGVASHLYLRANHVPTFCKDDLGAWLIKDSDLDESVQEIGRKMLQWAIVNTSDQIMAARERVAAEAEKLRQLEMKLQQARWSLAHQRGEIKSTLTTLVADRGQREIYEIDRLQRTHRIIAAGSLEVEHRLSVELQQTLIKELSSLDQELVKARSRFKHYRGDMNQGVKHEMDGLRQSLMNQLLKMSNHTYSLHMQAAVKNMQKDSSWQSGEDAKPSDASTRTKPLPPLRETQPVQPHQASGLAAKTAKSLAHEMPTRAIGLSTRGTARSDIW